jgi:hypothetical protein
MISPAVGRGSMKIRKAVLRLIEAERELVKEQVDGRITASIVRVVVVKKDAAGNIIERIVDGDN